MKFLKNGAFLALLTIGYLQVSAQSLPVNEPDYNKPRIFSDLPEKLNLRLTDAEALLTLPVGATVNATIANGLSLTGTVVSKSSPSDLSGQSVVVRTTSRQGAVFTFTRIKNANGTATYRGRVLGKGAGDALEIVKEGNAYIIRKQGYYDLINE